MKERIQTMKNREGKLLAWLCNAFLLNEDMPLLAIGGFAVCYLTGGVSREAMRTVLWILVAAAALGMMGKAAKRAKKIAVPKRAGIGWLASGVTAGVLWCWMRGTMDDRSALLCMAVAGTCLAVDYAAWLGEQGKTK